MNAQYQKCTLSTENGWVFHGREKNGVVDFQPIRYGLSPDGAYRWKAPRINYEYPDPVDGHLGERITCRQGQGGVEDCLFASIAIKKEYLENKQKVPILYHIHGGGFTGGSGRDLRIFEGFFKAGFGLGIPDARHEYSNERSIVSRCHGDRCKLSTRCMGMVLSE